MNVRLFGVGICKLKLLQSVSTQRRLTFDLCQDFLVSNIPLQGSSTCRAVVKIDDGALL